MKRNNILIIGVLLLAVGLIISLSAGAGGFTEKIKSISEPKNEVECTATVYAPGPLLALWKDIEIKDIECIRVDDCYINSITSFSFFGTEGNLEFITSDYKTKKSFDIGLFDTDREQKLTLKMCTATNSGILQLKDDEGTVMDKEVVTW